jgi:hypothetical protein
MVRIFRDIYLDCCRRRKDAGGLSQKQISGTGTGRNAWENRGRLSTGCQRAPCRAVCTACAVFFVSPQRVHVSRPARPCAPRPDSCTSTRSSYAADLTWATYALADLPTYPSPRCSSPAQGAKAQQKRERNAEKAPKGAKSQLEVNKAAMTLICQTCRQQFVSAAPLRPCRSPADGRVDEHNPAPGVRAPCLRRGCAAHSVRRLEQHTQDKHSKSVADCFPVRPLTSPACPSLAS